jgi:RimJ/RimL family protein N-acetyltransferase
MPPTPTITTDRLVLRAPELGDWEAFDAFMRSDRSVHVGGPRDDTWENWRSFNNIAGHWMLKGWGVFVVTDKATGTPMGMAGPWQPPTWPEPEIAWTLWDDATEGKGIAREAALAARTWAQAEMPDARFVSYIDPANARSAALAERLGAVLDPDATPLDEGDLVYRHPDPDADGSPEAYA